MEFLIWDRGHTTENVPGYIVDVIFIESMYGLRYVRGCGTYDSGYGCSRLFVADLTRGTVYICEKPC